MVHSLMETTTLSNDVKMPWLGFGVYKVPEDAAAEQAVKTAIDTGYRSIDTASFYDNEVGVGRGIAASDVPREALFVTTKVWNTQQGYDQTLAAFEESRKKLGLDVIDLYLVHWPVAATYQETWRALETLYKEGKVRAIGVCNFRIHHLETLLDECEINPMVNQVESHPRLSRRKLLRFCQSHDIQMEAWAPLMKAGILDHPVLTKLAGKYGKSAAQIVLRWHLQSGVVAIPKSVHAERIAENADVFDFELSVEDMQAVDDLDRHKRIKPLPQAFQ